MKAPSILNDSDWSYVLTLLPEGLEQSARQHQAIERARKIKSAEALLRVVLLYCFCGLSLSAVGSWWEQSGLGTLTKKAVEKRLQKSCNWIQALLCAKLTERTQNLKPGISGFRIRLVDATVVKRPGASKSIDWRIHTGFNLVESKIDRVEITSGEIGETFKNYPVEPGDLMIGDRGHAHREGIFSVLQQGGDVLVRLPWSNIPLQDEQAKPFDLFAALRSLEAAQAGDFTVQSVPDVKRCIPAIAGRLIALRKTPEQAEKSRRKILEEAKKKGKTPDSRTLEAAAYIFLFTTVSRDALDAGRALELYRLRWQIELAFKRLKGTLKIDEIPVKDEISCKTFLSAKLLGALLVEDLVKRYQDFSPWGYGLPGTILTPASLPAYQ